jgi:NAD(P)-dependent dehydrogenase (short-subunit alcohol dehydrogenase family)
MMHVPAWELGKQRIGVNTVNPGGVETLMLTEGRMGERALAVWPDYIGNNRNLMPVEWQPVESISDAVLWLVPDEGEDVTGVALPVTPAGATTRRRP